ncbi:hypothetical protein [Streptomyces avermitilis]|uniref:hypothetical protein n=1 Tax=Streptomyces avermitilis TaxID=33903 RepID=UPI0036BA2BFC
MDDPVPGDLQELACRLGLHPLAVEDAVQAHQRPKRERYGEVLAVRRRHCGTSRTAAK